MFSKPEKQHEWLKRFVGEWTNEAECLMGPGQPVQTLRGRESVRMLGDLWIVAEGTSSTPGGGSMTSLMTLGYDPHKKRFVGSWIGSPMASQFVYEGELDAAGVVLPLTSTGPSFADPAKIATYQDVQEIHPDGRRVMWSQVRGDDGAWTRFMTVNYRRVK